MYFWQFFVCICDIRSRFIICGIVRTPQSGLPCISQLINGLWHSVHSDDEHDFQKRLDREKYIQSAWTNTVDNIWEILHHPTDQWALTLTFSYDNNYDPELWRNSLLLWVPTLLFSISRFLCFFCFKISLLFYFKISLLFYFKISLLSTFVKTHISWLNP